MIIWKPVVGEHLQYMKEPTNEVNMNAVAVVRTNSHCKEEVVCHVKQKSPWLHPCFYPCPTAVWTSLQLRSASTMEVNTAWKSQWILIFMSVNRPWNWLKYNITNNEESLNETVNHRLMEDVYKFLGRIVLYGLLLGQRVMEKCSKG